MHSRLKGDIAKEIEMLPTEAEIREEFELRLSELRTPSNVRADLTSEMEARIEAIKRTE